MMRHLHSVKKSSMLYTTSMVGFFVTLHISIATYFNSSFLSTFVDEKTVSSIYLVISICTIIGFLLINKIVKKIGNYTTSICLIGIEIVLFYGIIFSNTAHVVIPLLILALSLINLIGFTVDIFLEKSTDIAHTGTIRGLYMTALNVAWILGPLLGGMLIIGDDYKGIYIAAFGFLFMLLYIIHKNFSKFRDPEYRIVSPRATLSAVLRDKNITKIFFINIILQTFYAWMTIYTPLYLSQHIGFGWGEISMIFTIMLIPFVFVQLPLGKLADKKWGEKELLAIGFIILGIATCVMTFITTRNFFLWALILFISRIGAASAEVMIETYFFKKVPPADSHILSMFRITRPLSYFIAPIITVVGLVYTTDANLFLILGSICLLTLISIIRLEDTR